MQKTARKPSSDPLQEKLRQDKTTWNKDMSAFINDIIHLKKTMNGWPSKFYKERSRITDPIPADAPTIIGALAGDFQELAQRGNSIVQEQLNYSKNRRKKQPKQLNLPHTEQQPTAPTTEAPKPPVDLTKQLSLPLAAAKFEEKYGLVAEGSNPLTRLYTRVVTPTRGTSPGARMRRLRMDLLKDTIKTYRGLGRLQVHVVSSSKESSTEAYKEMQRTFNDWLKVSRGFNLFRATQPGGKLSPDIESSPELKAEKPEAQESLEGAGDPLNEKPPTEPTTPVQTSAIPTKNVMPAPGTNQIVPFENKPMQTAASSQLEATAQAFLKKWLGKARHEWLPKSTSSYRLEVYKLAGAARKNLDKIMDHLEKGLDPNTLDLLMVDANKQMTAIKLMVRSIHMSEKPGAPIPMDMF